MIKNQTVTVNADVVILSSGFTIYYFPSNVSNSSKNHSHIWHQRTFLALV